MDNADRIRAIQDLPDLGVSGYFGPDSASWHIYKETIFLFGGVRALLLQVAHPAIADGVARFSSFEKDAFGRAFRTFLAMGTVYFGDTAQARSVGDRLFKMHGTIHGSYLEKQNDSTTLRSYVANDPDLLLWVLATLIDTSILVYEAMLGPLSAELKERFYQENRRTAVLMGIPYDVYPADYQLFKSYVDRTLTDGTLYLDDAGVRTGNAIIYHKLAPTFAVKYLAAGMLPDYLCAPGGIGQTEMSRKKVMRFLKAVGFFYRILPPFLRYAPAYYQAQYRISRSQNQTGNLMGRIWWAIARRFKRFPLTIQA